MQIKNKIQRNRILCQKIKKVNTEKQVDFTIFDYVDVPELTNIKMRIYNFSLKYEGFDIDKYV